MSNIRPVAGEFYRHFKCKYYQIIAIAKYSETMEEMVVYQALYGDYGIYVRPLSMFVSEVDHIKYPKVTQKYRFEKVCANEVGNIVNTGYEASQGISQVSQSSNDIGLDKNEPGDNSDNAAEKTLIKSENDTGVELSDKSEEQPNSILIGFLDTDGYSEKLEYIKQNVLKLDDDIIDAMAASLDFTIDPGNIDDRIAALKNCLYMHAKYEISRNRF